MDNEQPKIDERNRIFKILVEQICVQIEGIENWKKLENCPTEIKEKQIYGFECQLLALTAFGSRVFGYRVEDLIEYARKTTD